MKKLIILSWAALLRCTAAQAQTPFITMDSININNINATVLVHGDMWWDPQPHHENSKCFYPNGSVKNINFAGAIWMSGYDASNNLHVAAQTYRQDGNDYWPDPLNSDDTVTYSTSSDWAKIWKVSRTEIDSFNILPRHTLSNTPASILTWPGKGNTYAQGNGGVSLSITTNMAPFVDVNGNGIYEPLYGDYPDIKGDQALWWLFSDNGTTHSQTNAHPLGVEVHAMVYAFRRGTLIDNVVYYDYTLVNKSHNDYHNLRFGLWDDLDLGFVYDDFIGFDSTWRMGIVYNGTNDDGNSYGHPPNSYGPNPPQTGITMIELPGDSGADYVPAGSFIYYSEGFIITGDPGSDTVVDDYMRSKLPNGRHLSYDFSGAGTHSSGYGDSSGTHPTNYVFNGDPSDTSQWSECVCNNTPNDRRFVLSSNDFGLNAGGSAHIVLAQVVADSARGCPYTSFEKIRIVADTAWHRYHTLATQEIKELAQLNIYPNPAHDKLYIEDISIAADDISVCNTLGQRLRIAPVKSGNRYELALGNLSPGMYYLMCKKGDMPIVSRFIKQ